MDHYQNFTSLPPEEERTFLVYEQRTQEAAKKSVVTGLIVGASFFVLVFMTVCVVYPHAGENLMAGEDMGMLADDKERKETRQTMETAPAPEAKPEGAAAPTADEPAPAPDDQAPPSDDESE